MDERREVTFVIVTEVFSADGLTVELKELNAITKTVPITGPKKAAPVAALEAAPARARKVNSEKVQPHCV